MAGEIMSRAAARAQGLKQYFTGKPCKHGHLCKRQVASGSCYDCLKRHSKNWRAANPDKVLRSWKKWRVANSETVKKWKAASASRPEVRERRKVYQATWYQTNKERDRPARLALYAAKRESRIAYSKAWVEANPERSREHFRMGMARRRARKRGAGGTHTAADLADIFRAQGGRCAYCRADLNKIKKHVDHIVPLARGGSNRRSNLQYLCQPCNQKKNWKDPNEFARSIGLLI